MTTHVTSLIHQAIQDFQNGKVADAEVLLQKVLQAAPNHFDALHIMGVVYVHQNEPLAAQEFFRKALEVNPNSRLAHFNLAAVLSQSGQDVEALPHHDKAVKLGANDQDAWVNYGKSLSNLKRRQEALACYENALKINPNHAQALNNQGALLYELLRYEEALPCFDKALAINPYLPVAWSNKGNTLRDLKRYDEALENYDRAIELDADSADDWINKGNILCNLNRYSEAVVHYDRAIQLKPDHDFLYGDRISAKMSICDWDDADLQFSELANKIKNNINAATPFTILGIKDSPSLQRKVADSYTQNFPVNHSLGALNRHSPKDKIRVGYFSKDFQNHATAFLTAELFELHDRNKFEIIAFSFGPDINDEMRNRLSVAFDRFIDVRDKSDQEIAQLSREMEIDIAVDLQGYQTEHRTGIFAYRAAPIQVNYLAYPGTMGAEYIDYIVSDKTLIPPESKQYYSEKIVFMPSSYQVNDRRRTISDRLFTREELGLPKTGFVYCSFNNHYKITPAIFDGWMRILKEVEGSVLWLLGGSQVTAENLQKEAVSRGVSAERLVFATYKKLPDHLARNRLADLFLDTLPYNAHTTASDALWAGLPVLTCPGESFASRVAASLLNAIQLPKLITHSQKEYEQLAIELAKNPAQLKEIKQKLASHRLTTPLFDTPSYVKHLEAAYATMIARYQADLPPDHIYVE